MTDFSAPTLHDSDAGIEFLLRKRIIGKVELSLSLQIKYKVTEDDAMQFFVSQCPVGEGYPSNLKSHVDYSYADENFDGRMTVAMMTLGFDVCDVDEVSEE